MVEIFLPRRIRDNCEENDEGGEGSGGGES